MIPAPGLPDYFSLFLLTLRGQRLPQNVLTLSAAGSNSRTLCDTSHSDVGSSEEGALLLDSGCTGRSPALAQTSFPFIVMGAELPQDADREEEMKGIHV